MVQNYELEDRIKDAKEQILRFISLNRLALTLTLIWGLVAGPAVGVFIVVLFYLPGIVFVLIWLAPALGFFILSLFFEQQHKYAVYEYTECVAERDRQSNSNSQ